MGAFAAGHAGDDFVVHQQRSGTDPASALHRVFNFYIPNFLAGLRIQRDETIFTGAHEKHSEANRQSSSLSVSVASILAWFVGIIPKQLSSTCIQRAHVVFLL